MSTKVAIVTGANKGIGYEIVKGLCTKFDGDVILTARNEERGLAAVQNLNKQNLHPKFHLLDVSCKESILRFRDYVKSTYGGTDILVNNAGVLDFDKSSSAFEEAKELIDINYRSLVTIAEFLFPLLRKDARVINMSSDWGLLSNIRKQEWLKKLIKPDLTIDEINNFVDSFLQSVRNGKGQSFAGSYGDYKVSKVALSALTFLQHRHYEKDPRNIAINCVHPGFVKTDMTRGCGEFGPERGARAPLYLALDAAPSVRGQFVWHDCSFVNWDD